MLEVSHSQQGNLMNQFYVHVRLFEATAEQTKNLKNLCLLPPASLVDNDFVHHDLTPKPIKLDS